MELACIRSPHAMKEEIRDFLTKLFFSVFFKTIKPNGMKLELNRQKRKKSPQKRKEYSKR